MLNNSTHYQVHQKGQTENKRLKKNFTKEKKIIIVPVLKTIKMNHPLNQILYGPPGTGKTYHSIYFALSIIEDKSIEELKKESWETIKARFDQLLIRELDKEPQLGRIGFITFHQSLAYEDFIEGIKPSLKPNDKGKQVKYDVQDGIFRKMCQISDYLLMLVPDAPVVTEQEDMHEAPEPEQPSTIESDNHSSGQPTENNTKKWTTNSSEQYDAYVDWVNKQSTKVNIKSYNKSKDVSKGKLYTISEADHKNIKVSKPDEAQPVDRSKEVITTVLNAFPDLSNISPTLLRVVIAGDSSVAWAVANAIQIRDLETNPPLTPVITPPPLTVPTRGLLASHTPPKPRCVLIIDEINRGNVSQIFGELITLIEDGKRKGEGQRDTLGVILPYSREYFEVPKNLYIIGTMNTADRSVEAIDTALRRRFSFIEMMPEETHEKIRTQNINGTDFNFQEVLATINKRLEKLVGRDHKIGHSYFMSEKEEGWQFYLKAFTDKIIPLLQEYFFGDYAKMCLVVGKGFVDINPDLTNPGDNFFAKAEHDSLDDFMAKKVWQIKVWQIEAENTDAEFANALNMLINN